MSRLKILLSLVAVLAAAAVVFVGMLRSAGHHLAQIRPEDLVAQLARNHDGPGPCLRWPNPNDMPAGVNEAARALHAVGFDRNEFKTVGYIWIVWGHERETNFHRMSEMDEVEAALSDNFFDSLAAKVGRTAREGAFAAKDGRRSAAAEAVFHRMTPESQRLLRSIFNAHPALGTPRGVVEVIKALNEADADTTLSDGPQRMKAPAPKPAPVQPAAGKLQPH